MLFCIPGHPSQTCLQCYVHGLENGCHLRREKRVSSLFERDLFREPVWSSLEEEFSEQVVRLVIVVKDHITATDTLRIPLTIYSSPNSSEFSAPQFPQLEKK